MYIGTVGRRRPSHSWRRSKTFSTFFLALESYFSYCSANKNILLVLLLVIAVVCACTAAVCGALRLVYIFLLRIAKIYKLQRIKNKGMSK